MLRRFFLMLLCLCVFLPCLPAAAHETGAAQDISGTALIARKQGFSNTHRLFDKDEITPSNVGSGASLTLEYADGIGSLYLIFDVEYGGYTVTDNATGAVIPCGEEGFLHEFIDLEAAFGAAPVSVTLSFENGSLKLNELYVFTTGEVPDFVQQWQTPADGKTDLVLFSTHGDDEQLFFAGLLPYYAGELGYQVQVVYLTNHRNLTNQRCHEMLDGLWAVGVSAYPVFGQFGDYYSEAGDKALSIYNYMGVTEEQLLGFVVEQLRRFKPLVAVGHDPEGEYGHGMHMLYAELLCQAVETANDSDRYPESAQAYGLWDTPKTYLHLYPENPITMNWDLPLERFDGMTAFQVTKHLGFTCHKSQYYDFAWYIAHPERAVDVEKYSPCYYGLFRSTVGADAEENDFFENLITYAEAERLEEEARQSAEEASTQPSEPAPPTVPSTQTLPPVTEPAANTPASFRISYAAGGILLGLLLLFSCCFFRRKNKRKEF